MAWIQPKTWSSEPLIASDMNTHIRDNLNALKDPPTESYEFNTNYSTTSTSFVDVDATNLSLTITTTGGDVLIGAMLYHDNGRIYFDVTQDGARLGDSSHGLASSNGFEGMTTLLFLVTGLAAGTYTFNLQWKVGTGTRNLNLNPAPTNQFWVREVS